MQCERREWGGRRGGAGGGFEDIIILDYKTEVDRSTVANSHLRSRAAPATKQAVKGRN
jgi:hypothetical protein